MQRVRAFHSDQFVLPLPPGHPFPMSKYRLLREAAEATLPGVRVTEAPPASDGELALAHEPDWIHAVTTGSTSAAQQREIGFPWSERMVERARRSVGATVCAARTALLGGEGVAANLAGGTHHAYSHKGSGYCVFNDVAVAAEAFRTDAAAHPDAWFAAGWLEAHLAVTARSAHKALVKVAEGGKFWN